MEMVCEVRGFDRGNTIVPGLLSTDNVGSIGGLYSSDVGKLVKRSTDASKFVLAIGTTESRSTSYASTVMQLYGYLHGLEADPTTEGSTNKLYIHKFNANQEYAMKYSTLYSATLPASSDIGSYIGLSNTTTVAGACLSMATISSTGHGSTSGRPFMITGFDNNRRKLYVKPMVDSGQIAW